MQSRQKIELSVLAALVAVSRFAFRSHRLYDLDSVNFALGILRFDPRVHQPHPPGYFLYVLAGRVLTSLVHDPNLALVLISILASMAALICIYLLALDWFGARAATFAGLIFLFSPLEWFHGTVALTYAVEGCASALVGLLCWRIVNGRAGFIAPTAIVLGLMAGVRPSSIVFLGPLFLFSIRRATIRQIALGLGVLGVTAAAWFFPMLAASGGFHNYFGALASLWKMVPSKGTIFNSSPVNSVARACMIVFIGFLCFGGACLAFFAAGYRAEPAARYKKLFTAVWIVPALCFFTLIFLKFVNSGYLLLVASPVCVWLGGWAAAWYENAAWTRWLKMALISTAVIVNIVIFLLFPAYCSSRSIRHFEAELDVTEQSLPSLEEPSKLVVVAFDNHAMGFRHAGYYLPDYLTLEYPAANLVEGKRIFAMHNQDTSLLANLPADGYKRFVFFPLPPGEPEYEAYLAKVEALIPASDLQRTQIGGETYVTAPIRDLGKLFPDTPPAPPKP